VLGRCPTNGYNSLVMRHLARPKNVCTYNFPRLFLRDVYGTTLMADYVAGWMHYADGCWRKGKPQTKLNSIDRSEVWDPIEHSKAKGQLKKECLTKVEPKKARAIQFSVNDATAYEHAPEYYAYAYALKQLGGTVQHIMCADGGQIKARFIYAGGLNHTEIAEIMDSWQERRGHAYKLFDEMDGANWDSTMQENTMTAESEVYRFLGMRAFHGCVTASRTVKSSLHATDNALRKVRIRYTTKWKRLSGKWNTTVGNVTIAVEIRFFTLTHLPPHLRPAEVECLFMGDDYAAVYWFDHDVDPNALCAALNYFDSCCGITPERGLFRNVTDITFISLGVWLTRSGRVALAPHPGRQFNKLFWTVSDALDPVKRAMIASGISEAFWPTYKGFELMEQFLKVHCTSHKRMAPEIWYLEQLTRTPLDIDWAAGFVHKYNLPISALPRRLPSHNGNTVIIRHPIIEMMMAIEGLDPCDRPSCVGRP